MRYEAYELERAVVGALGPRRALREARLYVILTAEVAGTSLAEAARRAVDGGAQILQVREKTMSDRGLVAAVRRVVALARPRGVPVLVDDRVDVALASGAHGVHLGDDDLLIADARRLLGPAAIVGATAHSASEARRAERAGADYVSVGPMYATPLKPLLPARGAGYLAEVKRLGLPFFCIGGITAENAKRRFVRVAVCSAVTAAKDPAAAARALRRSLTSGA